ncbi:MAG: hypothetical protein H6820_12845 [Phycisphaerales bacterium]|nr:hypothetical protein [Phycisphaerales bacterium]
MRRLTYQLSLSITVLGAIGLIVPAAALPCLADTCRVMPAAEAECCASHACSTVPGDSPVKSESSDRDGPCECPPTCPAPCGYGKVPCSTSLVVGVIVAWTPVTEVVPITDSRPASQTCAGVFHPPRA